MKDTLKYLLIHIIKNLADRHSGKLFFFFKGNIFNLCLEKDLSVYGRVLFSKAEEPAHFIYPSVFFVVVNDSTEGEVNHMD